MLKTHRIPWTPSDENPFHHCAPMLPGDLLGEEWPPMSNDALKDILEGLKYKLAQPPKKMTAHGEKQVYMPESALQAEYVFVKRGNRPIRQRRRLIRYGA